MKRQLLSAVLSSATLSTSCAAAFVQPEPKPFLCATIGIGQGQKACESLLAAISSGDMEQYKQADSEGRRITSKLRVSFGEKDYEDAYQQAIEEVWKKGKAVNIYRRVEWRCLDLAEKRKRLSESPHEEDCQHKPSTLLRDPEIEARTRELCWRVGQFAEKNPGVFAAHPHGALARKIAVLWAEQPDAWQDGERKPRVALSNLIVEASVRLGISRKDAERGIRALREIAFAHFPH